MSDWKESGTGKDPRQPYLNSCGARFVPAIFSVLVQTKTSLKKATVKTSKSTGPGQMETFSPLNAKPRNCHRAQGTAPHPKMVGRTRRAATVAFRLPRLNRGPLAPSSRSNEGAWPRSQNPPRCLNQGLGRPGRRPPANRQWDTLGGIVA